MSKKQDIDKPTGEDMVDLLVAAGIDPDEIADAFGEEGIGDWDEEEEDEDYLNEIDTDKMIRAISTTALREGPDDFCEFVSANFDEIVEGNKMDERVGDILLIGYKIGLAQENGRSANDLGVLFYMGQIFKQDYRQATRLYKKAYRWGRYQGLINLGYVYEYGRTGEKDYAKAYQCYSVAAALTENYEAIYKLGDVYARGYLGKPDMDTAMELWEKSYDIAQRPPQIAQPAFRIAQQYLKPGKYFDPEFDPLHALRLFQEAETGLRISVALGHPYYKERLQEAIEGQRQARKVLDSTSK
ncbi:MAG: sel1 repeat family protein [Coriobacteriaceae bacterium]|nr:MAG: sel1 repeat family protein [Coriobacteriaceae bacterium]